MLKRFTMASVWFVCYFYLELKDLIRLIPSTYREFREDLPFLLHEKIWPWEKRKLEDYIFATTLESVKPIVFKETEAVVQDTTERVLH